MANDYVTTADLEANMSLDATKYGTLMQSMLDVAAEHINRLCNRYPDGFKADTVASARLFVGNGTGVLNIDECIEITQVAVKTAYTSDTYVNWLTSDWIAFRGSSKRPNFTAPSTSLKPYTKIMTNRASGNYSYFTNGYTDGYYAGFPSDRYVESTNPVYQPTVQITAKWGYAATVPEVIKECVMIYATRLIKRAQAAYGDAIGSAEFGEIRYTNIMDKDIKSMLYMGGYMKPSV